jgi:hypothetical protein
MSPAWVLVSIFIGCVESLTMDAQPVVASTTAEAADRIAVVLSMWGSLSVELALLDRPEELPVLGRPPWGCCQALAGAG